MKGIGFAFIGSCLIFLVGCGGGSSNSNGVSVSASITRVGSFLPGEEVPLMIETTNFTLAAPFNMRQGQESPHHVLKKDSFLRHDDTEEGEHSESEMVHIEEEGEHHHDEDHGHSDVDDDHHQSDDSLNPDAREGHYHIYLNDAEGTDPHLTAWQHQTIFKLPHEIEEGTHTLRVELRDNNHVRIGVETIVFIDVIPE